jgi:hypothetical protein
VAERWQEGVRAIGCVLQLGPTCRSACFRKAPAPKSSEDGEEAKKRATDPKRIQDQIGKLRERLEAHETKISLKVCVWGSLPFLLTCLGLCRMTTKRLRWGRPKSTTWTRG